MSQLAVKECILNSVPKTCDLDPILSKLLIECLDSILPSLTVLFNSSLASDIFPQCFKSALVTPILKSGLLITMMSVSGYRGRRFELRQQYVISLSKILYLHCFSRLSCEMSTGW